MEAKKLVVIHITGWCIFTCFSIFYNTHKHKNHNKEIQTEIQTDSIIIEIKKP